MNDDVNAELKWKKTRNRANVSHDWALAVDFQTFLFVELISWAIRWTLKPLVYSVYLEQGYKVLEKMSGQWKIKAVLVRMLNDVM